MFSQLKSDGRYRPADVLVPASASGGDEAQALDVVITDPTCKTSLEKLSHKEALKAASEAHKRKMQRYQRQLEDAGQAGLSFVKVPLAFETTGAMGKETQDWWKSVLELEQRERGDVVAPSRRDMGLESYLDSKFVCFVLVAIDVHGECEGSGRVSNVVDWEVPASWRGAFCLQGLRSYTLHSTRRS